MKFRQVSQLGPFLGSIRRVKPEDEEYKQVIVYDEIDYGNEIGSLGKASKKLLWYKIIDNFSIDTFRRILKKAFDANKMRYSDGLADSFLLLYSYFQNASEPSEMMEEIFLQIQNVSLCQYFLLPAKITPDFRGFKFGAFTFGELDERKLEYRCKKATSDYFERYHTKLKNRLSIEREFQTIPIIAWQSIINKYPVANSFSEALLIYFEKLSELLFEDFWVSFTEQQSLQISLGIPYINVEKFTRQLYAEKISVYSNINAFNKSIGYVVPMQQSSLNVSFPHSLNDRIGEKKIELLTKFGFIEFTNSEFHKTIQSYSKFIAKAYVHLDESRYNEAFLHFVIALDLLFGDKGESTQTVSKRAAILTHLTFDVTFDEQKRTLQKIYDIRSRYVHSGINIDDTSLLKYLMRICRITLEVLFDLQSQKDSHQFEAFVKWIKKLDYIIVSYDAEVLISQEELKKIGIYKHELPAIDDF
ncbi:MAG TPA: hypothetical protein VFE53_06995 [Mucilaginibacter sp.]|jgi:hypothetical protein|nr:hypothetical protein [Mucilaginibacter sp.]